MKRLFYPYKPKRILLKCLLAFLFFQFSGISLKAQYQNSNATQITDATFPGHSEARILRVTVEGAANLTEMSFTAAGSDDLADIDYARLFYTGSTNQIDRGFLPAELLGSAITNVNDTFTFTFNQNTSTGVNNFWLVYKVSKDATIDNELDAVLVSLVANNNTETPTNGNPSGNVLIRPHSEYSYCGLTVNIPNSQLGTAIGIYNVKLENLDHNTTDLDTVTFIDTLPIPQLFRNNDYPIEVEIGPLNSERVAIYVDLNFNGFYEEDELVLLDAGPIPGGSTLEAMLNIPCDADLGITRMRILSDFWVFNITPCGPNTYGDANEYQIELLPDPQPTADFSGDSIFYIGQEAELTNLSSKIGDTRYYWDYGNDGQDIDSVREDGRFTLTDIQDTGIYDVKLTTRYFGCDSILEDEIIRSFVVEYPNATPSSDFDVEDTTLTTILDPVRFLDKSTLGANAWSWNIEPATIDGVPTYTYINGTDANSKNPEVLFSETGLYSVTLTASNVEGTGSTTTRTDYIEVVDAILMCGNIISSDEPKGFLLDDGGRDENYVVSDNNTDGTTCGFLIEPDCADSIFFSFLWLELSATTSSACPGLSPDNIRIYDGRDETGTPLHVNAGFTNGIAAGVNVAALPTFVATSGAMYIEFFKNCGGAARGFEAAWSTALLNATFVEADFELPGDTIYVDQELAYHSRAAGNPIAHQWDFEYDSIINSRVSPAFYTFTETGLHDIRYIAQSCQLFDTIVKSIYVLPVTSPPEVDFEADKVIATTNERIQLNDLSLEGPNEWEWSFEPANVTYLEETTPNSQNPVVEFAQEGIYSVTLTARNALGQDVATKTDYIEIFDFCIPNVLNTSTDLRINDFILVAKASGDTVLRLDNLNFSERYFHLSNVSVDLVPSGEYEATISRNTTANRARRGLWIDIDGDKRFSDDMVEMVVAEPAGQMRSVTESFMVSPDAVLRPSRMRMGIGHGSLGLPGCGPAEVGQYLDINVNFVRDETTPSISLIGADTLYVEKGFGVEDPGATAFDPFNGDITDRIVYDYSQVDTLTVGTYQISYNVSDLSGNEAPTKFRYVVVMPDVTPPDMTLIGPEEIYVEVFNGYDEQGATAIDLVDGDLTAVINITGEVDTNRLGGYVLTYSATDSSGNTAQIERLVVVGDTTAPTLTLTNTAPVGIPVFGSVDLEADFIAEDNYDLNPSIETSGLINPGRLDSFFITFTAVDSSGNRSNSITRTFFTFDSIAPMIELIGRDTVRTALNEPYEDLGVVVSDNFYGTNELTIEMDDNVNTEELGTYFVDYAVEDPSGNRSETITRVVIVDDLVGLDEFNRNHMIKVYPNPAKDFVQIELLFDEYLQTDITITDNKGRMIGTLNSGDFEGQQYQLDVHHLASGVYHLNIFRDDRHYTKKFIVVR